MLLNIIRKVLYQEDLGRKVAKQPETPLLRVGLTSNFSWLLASSCSSTNWVRTSKKIRSVTIPKLSQEPCAFHVDKNPSTT